MLIFNTVLLILIFLLCCLEPIKVILKDFKNLPNELKYYLKESSKENIRNYSKPFSCFLSLLGIFIKIIFVIFEIINLLSNSIVILIKYLNKNISWLLKYIVIPYLITLTFVNFSSESPSESIKTIVDFFDELNSLIFAPGIQGILLGLSIVTLLELLITNFVLKTSPPIIQDIFQKCFNLLWVLYFVLVYNLTTSIFFTLSEKIKTGDSLTILPMYYGFTLILSNIIINTISHLKTESKSSISIESVESCVI